MKNFRIGTIYGIPIYANVTLVVFLPVLAWLLSQPAQIDAYADVIAAVSGRTVDQVALTAGSTPALLGVGGAVGLMAAVLVHELGHSWAARRYDIVIVSITLWIFGGMARMEDLPEDWNVEFWVALAGPITSLLLAAACFAVLSVVPTSSPVLLFVVGWLAVVNLSLAIFNMVPAFPMDGGRILRALLARRGDYATATRRAARLAKVIAVAMALVAILGGAPLLVFIAMFVYVAATSEARTTALRGLLEGYTARDLMQADAPAVHADLPVAQLLERSISTKRDGFPVVDGGTVLGYVTLADAVDVDAAERDAVTVSAIMGDPPASVAATDDAFDVLVAMSESRQPQVLVVDGEDLVGVVGQSDVLATIELLQGLGPGGRAPPAPEGYA